MTTQQEALQRIANMDPEGLRADDLGKAARIAREALAVSKQAAQEPQPDEWSLAQTICDLPEVDEAIRGLPDDPTGDNATMVVRAVMRAYAAKHSVEVTDEMVRAYLDANTAYWNEQDSLPPKNPSKWRNGTPQEATAVSLRATLAAKPAEQEKALTLETAPIGTKAPSITGGAWTKTERGWKWANGGTFPRPGGDWNGKLIPPAEAEQPAIKESLTTEQAPPTFNSIGIAENWSVTVEACGECVLCISDQHCAGASDLEPYRETITNCARHLLAFIGEQAPQVMGRVHNDDGQGLAFLNSVGRKLPDGAPLYATPEDAAAAAKGTQ